MPHSKKKNLWKTNTYFYPQNAASATLSGHIGPNKEKKKKYSIFEKKAEKMKEAWEKRAEVGRENWGKLEVTKISRERDEDNRSQGKGQHDGQ